MIRCSSYIIETRDRLKFFLKKFFFSFFVKIQTICILKIIKFFSFQRIYFCKKSQNLMFFEQSTGKPLVVYCRLTMLFCRLFLGMVLPFQGFFKLFLKILQSLFFGRPSCLQKFL